MVPSPRCAIPLSSPDAWLRPTRFINSDHPEVQAKAKELCANATTDVERARAVFLFVRDGIKFALPHQFDSLSASQVLSQGIGFCNPKATLFCAMLRAAGIPARMHMVSINMNINSGTGMVDGIYGDHAYSEVYINGSWRRLDSYVVDSQLYAAAMAKIKALGWTCGYGVHKDGVNDWDGESDSFVQYIMPPSNSSSSAGTDSSTACESSGSDVQQARHSGRTGVGRDEPMSDRDFGVVEDIADFTRRPVDSPFATLRQWWFRPVFYLLSSYCNSRIQAVREGRA